MGDSIGHWEGDTLIVDTTNFNGRLAYSREIPYLSDQLHTTERFTIADANTIDYEVTIDDPKTYGQAWKVAFPLTQEPGYQNFEYACHEGNYAMFNSLSGARAKEKAEADAKNKK